MKKKKVTDIYMEECKRCKVLPIIETDILENGAEVVYVHCPLCKNRSDIFYDSYFKLLHANKNRAKKAAIKNWNKRMKTDG